MSIVVFLAPKEINSFLKVLQKKATPPPTPPLPIGSEPYLRFGASVQPFGHRLLAPRLHRPTASAKWVGQVSPKKGGRAKLVEERMEGGSVTGNDRVKNRSSMELL